MKELDSKKMPGPSDETGRFNFGCELARQGHPYPDEDWWAEHTTCNVYDSEEAQHTMWTEDACMGWLWFHADDLVKARAQRDELAAALRGELDHLDMIEDNWCGGAGDLRERLVSIAESLRAALAKVEEST